MKGKVIRIEDGINQGGSIELVITWIIVTIIGCL